MYSIWFIMLVVLLFMSLFSPVSSQSICEFGCVCFENILECSNIQFTNLPEFAEVVRLSTQKLMLRNMDNLDLSSLQIGAWTNLKEIDLTGNNFIYFNKILWDYFKLVIVLFFKEKHFVFRFSKRMWYSKRFRKHKGVWLWKENHCWSFSFKVANNEEAKIYFRRDDKQIPTQQQLSLLKKMLLNMTLS